MEIKHTFIEHSLVPWLGKTMKLIDNCLADTLSENNIDLSKTQFVLLKNIEENEGLSQNELAFFSNKDKSSLARIIATLEKKKYIKKKFCDDDKRKCKIKISPKGKEVLLEAAPYLANFVKVMEKDLSDKDKQETKRILSIIQNSIMGDETSPFFKNKK